MFSIIPFVSPVRVFFFFFKFSFFSCFFLTHAALFCFLILRVSFKSKHLAGSNQDLVLKMPFDLQWPREARRGLPSVPNPGSGCPVAGKPKLLGKHSHFRFYFSMVLCLSPFSFSSFLFFNLSSSPVCLLFPGF